MKYIILIFLSLSINAFSQNIRAENELKLALSDKPQSNFIDNERLIIKDSLTAINVAEYILFNIYGKDNIENQKPYETHLIENHWVISGTLQKGMKGGTFLIIIDARNSKVLKISHGK